MVRGADLVERANALLRIVGKEGFENVDELKRSACSMFVYLFERLFEARLEGVIRRPALKADYAQNADTVLQALSEMTGEDMNDLSGAEMANGNVEHISAMLQEFERIVEAEDRENDVMSPAHGQVRELFDEDSGLLRNEDLDMEDDERLSYGEGADFHENGQFEDDFYGDGYYAEEHEGLLYEDELDGRRSSRYQDADFYEREDLHDMEGGDMFEDEEERLYYRDSGRRKMPDEPSVSSLDTSEEARASYQPRLSSLRRTGPSPALNRLRRTLRQLPSVTSSETPSEDVDEDGYEDEDIWRRMVDRFPQQRMTREKQLEAIRSLAQHRNEQVGKNVYSVELEKQRQRDKGRFRKAYQSIIDDERREDRLRDERRRMVEAMERKRQAYEEKIERTRIRRLADDLARDAKSRRQKRKDREDALVKRMFDDALATEKERVLRASAAASEERARQDKDALMRYEAARKVYEDRKDMLDEKLKEKEKLEKVQKKNRQEQLRRLSRELKEEFEKKLRQARIALDAQEERVFQVNAEVIERAFSVLNDNRAALYQATVSSFAS